MQNINDYKHSLITYAFMLINEYFKKVVYFFPLKEEASQGPRRILELRFKICFQTDVLKINPKF
jgi:hypothetical protein